MTREEAIAWYCEIGNGDGVDRDAALPVLHRGEMAKDLWYDGKFSYGIEYGVMIALILAFDLTREELDAYPPKEQK